MSDNRGLPAGAIKDIIKAALNGTSVYTGGKAENNPVSNMEMARIISNLKAVRANKDAKNEAVGEGSEVYKEPNEEKKERENSQKNSLSNEINDYNQRCGDSEVISEQQPSYEINNEQLTQAIIYSEILGKPKCKTRRRG